MTPLETVIIDGLGFLILLLLFFGGLEYIQGAMEKYHQDRMAQLGGGFYRSKIDAHHSRGGMIVACAIFLFFVTMLLKWWMIPQ